MGELVTLRIESGPEAVLRAQARVGRLFVPGVGFRTGPPVPEAEMPGYLRSVLGWGVSNG